MITSKDVRNKRFEKAAFGYKQEEIDEFLSQLEAELDEMERERAEANNKIQILADKVREYMKDEDALKDALLGAQRQGHQVISEANEKAESIIAEAEAKAKKEAAAEALKAEKAVNEAIAKKVADKKAAEAAAKAEAEAAEAATEEAAAEAPAAEEAPAEA